MRKKKNMQIDSNIIISIIMEHVDIITASEDMDPK